MRQQRPAAADCHEYYHRYIDLVPDGDITTTLADQWRVTEALLDSIPTDKEEYRYAPDKWSVREVVGHLIDSERTFAYRALWIARAAEGSLPSMEQDDWAAVSPAHRRQLSRLVKEWDAVRASSIYLFRSFGEQAWTRVGTASDLQFTVRALPWIVAGHELHHRMLLERDYLGGAA